MKDTPPGWPRISSALFYDDAAAAIDWLCKAFGFEIRLKVEGEGGRIEHSELTYRDGLIMVGSAEGVHTAAHRKSPRAIGGKNTQSLFLYVDDVEAHRDQARAAGARIVTEPETHDYGGDYWVDRTYEAEDLEGHHWWFGQRMSTGGGGK
ncbi:MAG TPA: VOC family protein [Polyangiaceae bacterium]|nr:VOC family protein [Polyangiaceae bacterium]